MNASLPPSLGDLLRLGEWDRAERLVRQQLALNPGDARAHALMAQIESRAGRQVQALRSMAEACRLAPEEGELHYQFACLLAHAGRLPLATEHFKAALGQMPQHAEGWHLLGVVLSRQGNLPESRAALQEALRLAPQHPKALEALAQLEFRFGFPDDALPLWQQLLQARPLDLDVRLRTGETLNRLGRQREAAALFREGLAGAPDSAELWMALGQAEEDDGNRSAAAEAFDQALKLRPNWAFPMASRLGLGRAHAPDTLVTQASAMLAKGNLPDAEVAQLGYELGKVMDARGRYDSALAYWTQANSARQRQVGSPDVAQLASLADRIMASNPPSLFSCTGPKGSSDPRPVFIVGMPRSGTTLTEQIVASHPLAYGCGELPDIALIARSLGVMPSTGTPLPTTLHSLEAGTLAAAAQRYLAAATRHAPAEALRLVDKAPLNFFHLGLIALLFPQARVIWCRRDPRDIAVSIFGENFALDETRATSMEGIGHYILWQERLMKHWRDTLPLPMLELRYEELVSDLEPQARRITEFLGLSWDAGCLNFHESERGVQTPSRWQVRQPAHTRSIGRWRNYAEAVAPVLTVLGDEGYRGDASPSPSSAQAPGQ